MSAAYKYYGEHGQLVYHKGSPTQRYVVQDLIPLVKEVVGSVTVQDQFTIADYGCSDGGNSMSLIRAILDCIQGKCDRQLQVQLLFEDLPNNDFGSVVAAVTEMLESSQNSVFFSCIPVSFYQQCFPDNSVNVGISMTAMQWLSKSPCNNPHRCMFPQLNRSAEVSKKWKEAAAQDWETILLHRARELCQGGRAILVPLALGFHRSLKSYKVMDKVYDGMVHDGIITKDEFENTNMCQYMRTEDELREPFTPVSPVYRAGLRIVDIKQRFYPCQTTQAYCEMEEGNERKAEYANNLAECFRVITNHTLEAGLSNTRSVENKSQVLELFYKRFAQEVISAELGSLGMDISSHILIVSKVEAPPADG